MLELTLHVGAGVDASYVSEILVDLGALCVTTRDRNAGTSAEQPIFNEPAPDGDVFHADGKTPVPWTEAVLTAFFPMTASVEDVTMALLSDFELPATPSLSIVNSSPVPDHVLAKDWVSHVHQNFAAVQIDDLCIRSPWHETASLDSSVRHELVIEPGQAFGTGEHPTTQLVIGWVRLYAERVGTDTRWSVLDYGCGSGVLALTAIKYGAGFALGCDIDGKAVDIAIRNAKANSCEDLVKFGSNELEAQCFDGRGYNVVLANILAGPLTTLAPLLSSRVAQGGSIALSGVLASQALGVSKAFTQQGLTMQDAVVRAGWALLVGIRPL